MYTVCTNIRYVSPVFLYLMFTVNRFNLEIFIVLQPILLENHNILRSAIRKSENIIIIVKEYL